MRILGEWQMHQINEESARPILMAIALKKKTRRSNGSILLFSLTSAEKAPAKVSKENRSTYFGKVASKWIGQVGTKLLFAALAPLKWTSGNPTDCLSTIMFNLGTRPSFVNLSCSRQVGSIHLK